MKFQRQNLVFFLLLVLSISVSAQTPLFNSYPASSNVILLDFDGHVVEGTSWNSGSAIICQGSNLAPTQLSSIIDRIAEDYRPFTLNITTDPAVYEAAPVDHRMRVVFTTSSAWYGSAGGVSYINSFTWGDNTPCFVFTALLNYNAKQIAEAASHEIGHTLGLRHQSSYDNSCNKTAEYNVGKGTGEIGWAPIMGVGYYQNMTLWNYGANPFGCNSIQDDLSIITGNDNGVSYRPDDFGNDIASAAQVNFQTNSFSVAGLIEKPNDIDAFQFTLAIPSRLKADVNPYAIADGNVGSNIDIQVELIDQAQNVIGIYNPANTLNASIDTLLPAGTYYFRVQGKGNVYAPNYASLGSYTVMATLLPGGSALPVHQLQLKGIVENKQHKLTWQVIADEKIVSQTLEVANDGFAFQPIANLDVNQRSYMYASSNNITYYRLSVLFDNGRQYYTNVLALRSNGSNLKPSLIGNIVTSTLRVSSPSSYQYQIIDMSGRGLLKGVINTGVNTIPLNFSTSGIYLIKYYNGSELLTERFNKQ